MTEQLDAGILVWVKVDDWSPTRYGKVAYVQRNGLIAVNLFSPRLGRYVHGNSVYHPRFVHSLVGVAS